MKIIWEKSPNRIITAEDLLSIHNINSNERNIAKQKINKRDQAQNKKDGSTVIVELYQVLLELEPKHPLLQEDIKQILLDTFSSQIPIDNNPITSMNPTDVLVNINWADTHIGRDSIKNQDKYIKELEERTLELFHNLSLYDPSKIIFGSIWDIMNSELEGTTTKWTPQQNNITWPEMFSKTLKSHINLINEFSSKMPTDVVIIWWNHDRRLLHTLWEALELYYHNKKDIVNIDNKDDVRKYRSWWNNSLGFSHWDLEKHKQIPDLFHKEFILDKNNYHTHWHTHTRAIESIWPVEIDSVESPAPTSKREKDNFWIKSNTKIIWKIYDRKKWLITQMYN